MCGFIESKQPIHSSIVPRCAWDSIEGSHRVYSAENKELFRVMLSLMMMMMMRDALTSRKAFLEGESPKTIISSSHGEVLS